MLLCEGRRKWSSFGVCVCRVEKSDTERRYSLAVKLECAEPRASMGIFERQHPGTKKREVQKGCEFSIVVPLLEVPPKKT